MELLWDIGGPALFAGLVAIAVTVAIERWGGIAGGLLGTLPTTIVPAAVGFYATASDGLAFADALYATPAGMLVNAAFLYLWRVVPEHLPQGSLPKRLATTLTVTLFAWALGAALLTGGLVAARSMGWPLLPTAIALTLVTLLVGALACRNRPPAPRGSRSVKALVLLSRGGLAAVAIGTAVLLSKSGVPLLAGMAAVFPAIFLTTMVSLWLAQGEAVPSGAVGPMMLGSASVSAFALLAAWTFPLYGPLAGSALAWILAVVTVTAPASWWLSRTAPSSPAT